MATTYMSLFDKDDKCLAEKVLDYYDGDSKEHLRSFLDMHRKNALKKGMIPRARNLVKMIVEKSGMLFNGKQPVTNVYIGDNVDEVASATAQAIMETADWTEFFNNFDITLRLLKTQYLLVQVDPVSRKFAFTCLDQSNCAVEVDVFKTLTTLVYRTEELEDGCLYRVWTAVEYFDLKVDKYGNEEVVPGSTFPNPYGVIPAVPFHDTNTPREGAWNEIPEDLVEINDIYNLHLTDSEFSAMWAKQPTLFTNAKIQGGMGVTMEAVQHQGESLPRWVPSSDPGFVGGPGTVVAVETDGDAVYLDYKGPVPPLMDLDDIVKRWVTDFAADWSVAVASEGNGQADSGFKLVVKELPNLELRKKRARMFEAGFHRLYDILVAVAGTVNITLPPEGELWVDFGEPDLPIDEKASEEVWSRKISEKRATRVDYFMEVKGMSKAEAEQKVAEIDEQPEVRQDDMATIMILADRGDISGAAAVAEAQRRGIIGAGVVAQAPTATSGATKGTPKQVSGSL